MREQQRLLRHVADAARLGREADAARAVEPNVAGDLDPAARFAPQPGDRLEHAGLAGAGGAEQAERRLVGRPGERDVEARMARGMTAEAARAAARRALGELDLRKEACRDNWAVAALDKLARDVRHACRTLRRDAGFSVGVFVLLALGIGANVAMFSIVDSVLLEPLPYPGAERLMVVREVTPAFFRTLASWRPKAVVHVEPCYEHYPADSLLGMLRRRYVELNDYNRNLVSALRGLERAGELRVIAEQPALFGRNPLFPVSVIAWQPARTG